MWQVLRVRVQFSINRRGALVKSSAGLLIADRLHVFPRFNKSGQSDEIAQDAPDRRAFASAWI